MADVAQVTDENAQSNQVIAGETAKPVLRISDTTRQALGPIADKLLEWSEVQGSLVVIGGEDLRQFARLKALEYVHAAETRSGQKAEFKDSDVLTTYDPSFEKLLKNLNWASPTAFKDPNILIIRDRSFEKLSKNWSWASPTIERILDGPHKGQAIATINISSLVNDALSDLKAEWMRAYLEQYIPKAALDDFLKNIKDKVPHTEKSENISREKEISVNSFDDLYKGIIYKQATPFALSFKASEDGQHSLYGIIGIPDPSVSGRQWTADLAALDIESLDPIPGTDRDWWGLILGHESFHLRDKNLLSFKIDKNPVINNLNALDKEIFADNGVFSLDFVSDPNSSKNDIAAYFEAARAVGGLRQSPTYLAPYFPSTMAESFSDHATSAGITIGQDRNVITNTFNTAAIGAGVLNVNSLAALIAGRAGKKEYLENPNHRISVQIEMEKIDDTEEFDDRQTLKENLSRAYPELEESEIMQLIDAYEKSELMSSGLTSKDCYIRPEMVDLIVGAELMDDPLVHYAAVRTALEKGFFPKDSAEETIAREFVEGFEKLVKPEFFHSDEMKKMLRNFGQISNASPEFAQTLKSVNPMDVLEGKTAITNELIHQADKFVSQPAATNNIRP